MRSYRVILAVLAIALLAAWPAFANPVPNSISDPVFLPSVIVLIVASSVLMEVCGLDRALGNKRSRKVQNGLILLVVSLFVPMLIFMALVVWCLLIAFRMTALAFRVTASRECPPHLKSVRPKRMLLCAGLLALSVAGSVGVARATLAYARTPFHGRMAPMARTTVEVRSADLALTNLLEDAGVEDMHDLFVDPGSLVRPAMMETVAHQTEIVCELLNKGREAEVGVKPELKAKLRACYMEIERDPWDRKYQFYLGPLDCPVNEVPFRCNRWPEYLAYDKAAYEKEVTRRRGNPIPEDDIPPGDGYPAPRDLPVYIFSTGADERINQPWGPEYEALPREYKGGGDDINNWDVATGWSGLY